MANNNVQTTVTVGMDVNLAKRNAEALKQVIVDLKAQLKEARAAMDTAVSADAFKRAGEAVDNLILKIKTLEKVQRSATPAAAYESFISGDTMNSNTLRQAQRGAKNRLNTVNEFAGDKEARKFLDDIDRTQMRLNRLQAGFTNPLQAVRRELNDLSGGELKRLHTLLQQEQVLVKGNESAWSAYSAAIAKVDERIREYDTLARQQMGASILSQSQRNGFAQANERDINRAIEKLREYRTVINDPNGAGKATWEATTREILKLQATLDTLKQKTAEMKGEAMSLTSAYRAGLQAGNGTFKGSTQQLELAKKTLQDQLALVERGSKQYNQLQKAIQGCEMEEKRMGMTAKEVQAVLDKPKGKSYNELKIAVEQGRMALAKMRTETDADKKKFDELAAKVKEADIQMKQLANTSKGSATAFEKAWSRLKTYISLYMGAAVAIQKLTATFGDLMELSDKMGEVRKTTGFTADEVGRLSENLKKMDVRTPLTQLMEVSAAAGQLGLKTQEDVLGFTEAANKLMIALPEMGKEAATEMMRVAIATGEVEKIRKQMQEGVIDGSSATAVAMEKIASTIDRLRASSASTAPEITDFVKRVGAVGAQSGITIDQVSALGSTISSLGLRIEMSATALSRMIPAIRNNAFDLAKNIGVTPDTIRNLFDTGRGMEVILMILQRMKDTNMDEDSIEAMLGMAGMRDIMKDLNQQGARAGIVFAGLSQGVDELRRQLGIAQKAYKENIAIQQEFDKMNETTAARWERLKNQLEEAFVGDQAQRFLGVIVDGLRSIVDLLVGNGGLSVALKTVLLYWAALRLGVGEALIIKLPKAIATLKATTTGFFTTAITGLKALTWEMGVHTMSVGRARVEWKRLDATMKSNVIGAIVAALGYLVYKLYDLHLAAKEAAAEMGRFNQKIADEQKALGSLFEPMKKSNLAQEERLRLIGEINSKYGRYLGYMLSETSSAIQLADAHALIAKRIKEEAYERRIMEQERKVQEGHNENLNAAYGKMEERVRSGIRNGANVQEVTDILKGIVDNRLGEIKYAYDDSGNIFKARTNYYIDPKIKQAIDGGIERLVVDGKLSRDNVNLIQKAVYKYTVEAHEQHKEMMSQTANLRSDLRGIQGAIKTDLTNNLRGLVNNIANMAKQPVPSPTTGGNGPLAPKPESFKFPWQSSGQNQGGFGLFNFGQQQQQQIATPMPGQLPKVNEKNLDEVRQYVENQDNLRTYLKEYAQQISDSDRQAAEAWLASENEVNRLRKLIPKGNVGGGGGGGTNPWGSHPSAESMNYQDMSAEVLVNRRKQMNQFVNAIQTDSDVKAVLAEDAALKKAIEKGMASDMRTVIEWYNTERLKIQDELHARHLTNTGDWLDPKKQKAAHKQFRNEIDAYLHELDAYYTERKTRIEEAGTDEGLTEAEIRNRTLSNEMEWRQRRAELQKLYARKSGEVTEEEQEAIYHIISERTGESEKLVKATIGKTNQFAKDIEKSGEKGAAIVHNWLSKLGLELERDYLRQQQALTKQMKAIQDIIDKERPFNGITRSLSENLATMDILTGDMRKEYDELMKKGADTTKFNERQHTEELRRTTFLLGEAENAYSTTIDNVMSKMREKDMTAWADWLQVRPEQQEAMMAQLRQTYDAIQDAIKKEASQLKKQAEIMWNNILVPGGDGKTTLKQLVDKTVAQLGIDQGRVSRANSLIGAGQASERVADKLAIKQMQIQLTMQEHYYNLMRKRGKAAVDLLEEQARLARERGEAEKATRLELDAQHARMALNLATAKEETELAKQREEIIARTEETQNRLYKELREWGDLLASSVQSVFEASHAGDKEYYNELAKMNLTGKGGPGAGTYIIIDNEGTPDAKAHYEYLDERQALEREHEIERENAQAEAWRKVMDDINMKMSESITDWINAFLQNQSIDANTAAVIANTQALYDTMGGKGSSDFSEAEKLSRNSEGFSVDGSGQVISAIPPTESSEQTATTSYWPRTEEEYNKMMGYDQAMWDNHVGYGIERLREMSENVAEMPSIVSNPVPTTDEQLQSLADKANAAADAKIAASERETNVVVNNANKQKEATKEANNEEVNSTTTSYAKMAAAVNMYGVAYQTMSNDNLDSFQKFQMFALQAAGQTAIAMLTTDVFKAEADEAVKLPGIFGKAVEGLGPIAGPIAFAAMTALLGGLMGMAVSKVAKSKSQISQVTGASVSAGRLATGMLTYAEGNVNEFTDPSSLTPGRQYNVDGADGKTYRARYMGKGAKTHITNGPEFHLVGEKGQEAIIDAHTTRNIQINEPEIWHTIQTLYNGGRITNSRVRRGRGMAAFAEGNLDEFEEMGAMGDMGTMKGIGLEEVTALRTSLDRQNELWERILAEGIHANFDVYGKGGLVDSYDTGKKNVTRHGERY